MSKCLEAYKTHMQNPQHRCPYHEWEAAWNARGKVDAEICREQSIRFAEAMNGKAAYGACECEKAIEQENERD